MSIRVVYCGLAGGMIATVLLALPLYFAVPAFYVAGRTPITPFVAIICGLLAAAIVAVTGYIAARWSWVVSRRAASGQGALAGLIAGLVAYLLVGVSAVGVVGAALILQRGAQPVAVENQGMPLLIESVVRVLWYTYMALWAVVLVSGFLGAAGGWFAARRRWGSRPATGNSLIRQTSALLTLLSTSINLIVTASITSSLAQRAQAAADQQGLTTSLPTIGIAAWPLATVLPIFFVSIWWNWRCIGARWTDAAATKRRNARGAASFTIVMSTISVLLLMMAVPATATQYLALCGLFGVITINTFGVRTVGRKTNTASEDIPSRIPQGRDWLEYGTLLWLMVSLQFVLGITAAAVSLVYGVSDFTSVLIHPSTAPEPLLSAPTAINNIFSTHLMLPLVALVVPAVVVPFTWLYYSLRLRVRRPKLVTSH